MVSPSNHQPYIYLTTIFLRQPQYKSFFFDSCFNVSISPRMRASFFIRGTVALSCVPHVELRSSVRSRIDRVEPAHARG